MAREQIKEGALVRLKSGTEGWIKGQVVEYTDLITYPPLGAAIYTGPGYKVYILEGKHKGQTIRVPANYVEPYKAGREPLYPHVPKKKEPLFPHVPKGQVVKLSATEGEVKHFWVEKNLPYETWAVIEIWPGGVARSPFGTKEEAIKREGEIWEGIYTLKLVPAPQEKFPAQYQALKKLYPYEFIQYHDDGDLTIQQLVPKPGAKVPVPFRELTKGPKYVVTTEGEVFAYYTTEEALKKILGSEHLPETIHFLAKVEGDPRGVVRKFCCRQCGECVSPELLGEGKFLDRISWLRSHYKDKHPGMWGKMSPMTDEDFEPVSPEYRHLVGLVSEPLPKEAD